MSAGPAEQYRLFESAGQKFAVIVCDGYFTVTHSALNVHVYSALQFMGGSWGAGRGAGGIGFVSDPLF